MTRDEKERLLSRVFEGGANRDDERRLAELLASDPDFRKAYDEALISHQALRDAGAEPMPAGLREEIRRAVEREPRAETTRVAGGLVPRWVLIPAAAFVVGLLALVISQLVPGPVSARSSIAVMAFRNQTGDTAFDYLQETIPNLLITSLEQSGCFEVMTMQRLKDLVRQSGKDPETAVLDQEEAIRICQRAGIKAIVVGSYTRAGDTFITQVKVLEASSGKPLETAGARGAGPASILETQVDEMSRGVTQGIGCPSSATAGAASRVINLATSSLEAYNLFLRGRDELERNRLADARQSLEQAVAIDSTFAVAHLCLSDVYSELWEPQAQEAALKEAMRFASRATERERLYIEASYANIIENDGDKCYRILRDLAEKYPAEKHAFASLGGYYQAHNLPTEALAAYQKALALDPDFGLALNRIAYVHAGLGQYEEALAYVERCAALQPGDPNPLDSIAELYFRMGRLEESAAKYRQVLDAHPDFINSWLALTYISALREDYPEAHRCLEEFIARAPSAGKECEGRWGRAFYDYLLGRCDRSVEQYRALRTDMAEIPYWPGISNWILGYLYIDRGEYDLAREAFDAWAAWLERSSPPDVVFNLFCRAMTRCPLELAQGHLDRAREAVTEMQRLYPGLRGLDQEDLRYKASLIQGYAAEVALACDSIDAAVSHAERMVSLVPSMTTYAITIANMPPLGDVPARAYWKKGDLDRAAAEYARLTRQAGAFSNRVSLCLIQPLYHYRFGRVLEERGDGERARAEYEKFLDIWKDADPRYPELADARERLARLSVPS